MQKHPVALPLNLATMQASFAASLQSLASHVANALDVAPTQRQLIAAPDTRWSYEFCRIATPDPAALSASYRTFVLRSAFQELADFSLRYLEQVRHACAVLRLVSRQHRDGGFPSEVYNKEVVHDARRFHWFALPKKLRFLTDEYGLSLAPALQAQTLSVALARNCLVHGGGIVTSGFLNTAAALDLSWQCLQVVCTHEGVERVVGPGDSGDAGDSLHLRVAVRTRSFPLGAHVDISASEFLDITLGVVIGSVDIRKALQNLGTELGSFQHEART